MFRVALPVAMALGLEGYALSTVLGAPPGADLPRHVALFLLAFALYLVACAWVLRARGSGTAGTVSLVVGVALAMRITMALGSPSLSDDVFRYIWDGKVVADGISPYSYAPSSQELAHLREPFWERINHKEALSPYPPLAQAYFALVNRLSPGDARGFQWSSVLFDTVTMAALIALLRRASYDPRRVLIYGWHPAVALHFAHSGHVDSLMVMLLVLSILFASVGRPTVAGLFLGLSTSAKLVPALLLPLVWRRKGPRTFLGFLPGVALPAILFLGSVANLTMSLAETAGESRFNDSVYWVFWKLAGFFFTEPGAIVSATVWLLGAAGVIYFTFAPGAQTRSYPSVSLGVLGLFLMLSPTVEPWYLTWLVPLLCVTLQSWSASSSPVLQPSLAWLLLSGLVMLTDLTYAYGTWVWPLVRVAEYGPFYAILGFWGARVIAKTNLKDICGLQ